MTKPGLDHVNIAIPTHRLAPLIMFYEQTLGMHQGKRPAFPFPGAWLYLDGVERAVLHLACYTDDDHDFALDTGRFHHFCLAMSGLDSCRDRLTEHGVDFTEQNRPNAAVVQVFFKDPAGVLVELSFDKVAEGLA